MKPTPHPEQTDGFKESQEFAESVSNNIWMPPKDFVRNMQRIFACAENEKWQWPKNWDCKYIDIRIDMRDGGHIITNKTGKRCSVESIEHQENW